VSAGAEKVKAEAAMMRIYAELVMSDTMMNKVELQRI
jgi:hypothetical protein